MCATLSHGDRWLEGSGGGDGCSGYGVMTQWVQRLFVIVCLVLSLSHTIEVLDYISCRF